MKRYCLSLDLKDDPLLIEEYKDYHRRVWPEILDSLTDSGILRMTIYLVLNRLVMMIDTDDHFTFEQKASKDASNERVQQWEALMWKYQQALPGAAPGEKWIVMDQIFTFTPECKDVLSEVPNRP